MCVEAQQGYTSVALAPTGRPYYAEKQILCGIQIDMISPSDVFPHFEEFFGVHESMHLGLVEANGGCHPFGINLAHGWSNSCQWASKLDSMSPNWSHPYPSGATGPAS